VGLISTPLRKLRELWVIAKNERASPKQIGWAVGVGCFMGCSPALGLHGGLALAAATLLRLNRLWCWLGSRSSNIFVLPLLAWAQVEAAHRLRTGAWVSIDRDRVLEEAQTLLLDWFLGMIPIGVPFSLALGLLAFAWARRRALARYKQGGALQEQK
jgi:uncharacterized protein (TIGR03382 family)